MRVLLIGAGSVGLVLGARLARAGARVRYVVRRPEQAAALRSGIFVRDPASGETLNAPVEAQFGFEPDPELTWDYVLVCVRASDTSRIAPALSSRFAAVPVVCVQNDVDNEATLTPGCRHVLGAVWRQTCTRQDDRSVVALGTPRIIVGAYPEGVTEATERLVRWLDRAGCSASASAQIQRDKWLKLCVNLMSAPNALVRPDDHATYAFVEGKARLLEEAEAVLAAAGIDAGSCDGKDRSLDAEITFVRASLARGTSARRIPVYNQVWRALTEQRATDGRATSGLEADRYHQRFCVLGKQLGIATPVNERVLGALNLAWQDRRGPECLSASELFPML